MRAFNRAHRDYCVQIFEMSPIRQEEALRNGEIDLALAPADLDNLPHPGVAFLKLRKPRRAMRFSAAWRKTGDLAGVEALVRMIRIEGGLEEAS